MKKVIFLILISLLIGLAGCGEYIDGTATGTMTIAYVGQEGSPLTSSREVVPKKTLYYKLKGIVIDNTELCTDSGIYKVFDNSDLYRVKAKKEDGAKLIESIKLVKKKLDTDYERVWYIAVELNDDLSDEEFKMSFTLTFTAKQDILYKHYGDTHWWPNPDNPGGIGPNAVMMTKGSKLVLKADPVWVRNQMLEGDQTMAAGDGGIVIKPIKNDDNEIIWENDNGTVAQLNFEADSDVDAFYPKLSTKWDDSEYTKYFADSDAFIVSFVGNPIISATSRPVLTLVSPFVDKDGQKTVASEQVTIYEVIDGALTDVTLSFKVGENDDGVTTFNLKTRTLGTYILSNGPAAGLNQ